MEYNLLEIGKRIRALRQEKNLSQDGLINELQKNVAIGRNTLSAIENGNAKHFELSLLTSLCDVFECEMGFLLCEYSCKTRETTDIFELTGLSEKACKTLSTLKNNHYAYIFVDLLLQAPEELLEKLSKKWLGYACVKQVVSPAVSKYKDDLERLKIVTDIEVDGVTLPKVPAQDMETYALFDLWLSFSEFINAITNDTV